SVWLAQSPLSEPCRRTLCSLPVVPGRTFGPAALQALERSVQVGQARQQFASLCQAPPAPPRPWFPLLLKLLRGTPWR
uniref:Uncharacterized protein n=1 Tax=Gouania willdenowi TaxID=441366 RepID=A0A8C5GIV6_GOUWI